MSLTLAFDVYGTLVDPASVLARLEEVAGSRAPEVSALWRSKQLEYSFRRALMKRFADFSVCTADALDYACAHYGFPLTPQQRDELAAAYADLPPFADVTPGLSSLRTSGYRMYAFSNGRAASVETLLKAAGIRDFLDGVVSVEEVESFKPDPAVYAHFLEQSGASVDSAWLVSSNPFDVIGAISFGMKTAWLRRSPSAVFDPWGGEPTLTISSLSELECSISGRT